MGVSSEIILRDKASQRNLNNNNIIISLLEILLMWGQIDEESLLLFHGKDYRLDFAETLQ